MKTILTPIDFSGVSDAVLAESAALARAVDARVVLLTVIQPPAVTHEYAAIMENVEEITAAGERNAERRLAKLQTDLAEEGVPSDSILLTGSPVQLIADQAEQLEADYIVMGSHGHTALYDFLVGSTTHGVLMRAKCPVIIIPSAKAKEAVRERSEFHAFA